MSAKLSSDCSALERVSYPAVSIDLILLITICCALRYVVLLFLFDCLISSSPSSPPLSFIIHDLQPLGPFHQPISLYAVLLALLSPSPFHTILRTVFHLLLLLPFFIPSILSLS